MTSEAGSTEANQLAASAHERLGKETPRGGLSG